MSNHRSTGLLLTVLIIITNPCLADEDLDAHRKALMQIMNQVPGAKPVTLEKVETPAPVELSKDAPAQAIVYEPVNFNDVNIDYHRSPSHRKNSRPHQADASTTGTCATANSFNTLQSTNPALALDRSGTHLPDDPCA